MNKYKYKAKDKAGKTVTGEVEAYSLSSASKLLRERGLVVLSLTPIGQGIFSVISRAQSRITSGDVTTFTRQLATMIGAGLPITDALIILRSQMKGGMQKVTSHVLADVEGGSSLSDALQKHPKAFSPIYIALIRAGETGGVLDDVLARLADNLEKQQEFRGKVKGAMIYPIVVVVGMFVVGMIMMVFVIPKLTSLYEEFDATLPTPTRILIGISGALAKIWPLMLVAIGLGIYGFRVYRKTEIGKLKTDQYLFKVPLIGPLQRQVILTEFARTLSLLIGAGVSILESLSVVAGVVNNKVISNAIEDASKRVEKGFPLAYSLAQHQEAFPFILSQMVAIGEETGKMSEVLAKVAHVFEVESDQQVKALTAAIEPIIMIILGVGVGFLVIAIILPIYNLTTQF